jgi:hypothetical protein
VPSGVDVGRPVAIAIAAGEIGDRGGAITHVSSIDRRDLDIVHSFCDLAPTHIESDVRATAITDTRHRAEREFARFLCVNAASGTSSSLVIERSSEPTQGHRDGSLDHAHIGAA